MAESVQTTAKKLLLLHKKLGPQLLEIDELKEKLRAASKKKGQGFTVEIAKLGTVEVSKGGERKLEGIFPQLQSEIFLKLPKIEQNGLLKKGLVKMAEVWSRGYRARVTVRL